MKKYSEIEIGDKASLIHEISEADISKFVDLTGDDNKLHINKEFASRTEFRKPVVHGMLGASFISTLIGTKLPGDGALWFSQTLEFLRPVRIGDVIKVEAEVIAKNDKLNSIELRINIINQNGQIVTTGLSKVKVLEIDSEENSKTVSESLKHTNRKSVLILGASGGVGKQVAEKLFEEGFDLFLHYNSNKSIVSELKSNLEIANRNIIIHKANLLIADEVNDLALALKRNFPNLTGFVNCSTIGLPNIKFENLEWTEIQKHIDINIKSSFLVLKEILPAFVNQKYGKIVFLTSQAIETTNSEWLHYIVSKSALHGFAKALAIEYAGKGINVNLVSPSLIDTDLVADIPKKTKMLIEAKTPLKRLCSTNDVAEAIAFLMSEKSDFITGETIRVNGGQVML
jgi:3-oxoacyl-[acyl-carrier protein] reductase